MQLKRIKRIKRKAPKKKTLNLDWSESRIKSKLEKSIYSKSYNTAKIQSLNKAFCLKYAKKIFNNDFIFFYFNLTI